MMMMKIPTIIDSDSEDDNEYLYDDEKGLDDEETDDDIEENSENSDDLKGVEQFNEVIAID